MWLANAHTHDVTLTRGQVIASIENMMSSSVDQIQPVDPRVVQETVKCEYAARRPPDAPSNEDAAFIRQHMNLSFDINTSNYSLNTTTSLVDQNKIWAGLILYNMKYN